MSNDKKFADLLAQSDRQFQLNSRRLAASVSAIRKSRKVAGRLVAASAGLIVLAGILYAAIFPGATSELDGKDYQLAATILAEPPEATSIDFQLLSNARHLPGETKNEIGQLKSEISFLENEFTQQRKILVKEKLSRSEVELPEISWVSF